MIVPAFVFSFFQLYPPARVARTGARTAAAAGGCMLVRRETLERAGGLAGIAERRGQSLAQLALAWVLRDATVASTLVGASSAAQLDENLGALANLHFTPDELREIDRYASDSGIDLWRESSDI